MNHELIFRFIQYLFSSYLFDIPLLMKGKLFILRRFIEIGKYSSIYHRTIMVAPHNNSKASIRIGHNVQIEHDCNIDYSGGLKIHDNVSISERVIILTHEHKIIHTKPRKDQEIHFDTLIIEEDAWIGAAAIILGSVRRIGKGAIIGAGSVIRKNVNDYEISMGNPAEVVGKRFEY